MREVPSAPVCPVTKTSRECGAPVAGIGPALRARASFRAPPCCRSRVTACRPAIVSLGCDGHSRSPCFR